MQRDDFMGGYTSDPAFGYQQEVIDVLQRQGVLSQEQVDALLSPPAALPPPTEPPSDVFVFGAGFVAAFGLRLFLGRLF